MNHSTQVRTLAGIILMIWLAAPLVAETEKTSPDPRTRIVIHFAPGAFQRPDFQPSAKEIKSQLALLESVNHDFASFDPQDLEDYVLGPNPEFFYELRPELPPVLAKAKSLFSFFQAGSPSKGVDSGNTIENAIYFISASDACPVGTSQVHQATKSFGAVPTKHLTAVNKVVKVCVNPEPFRAKFGEKRGPLILKDAVDLVHLLTRKNPTEKEERDFGANIDRLLPSASATAGLRRHAVLVDGRSPATH